MRRIWGSYAALLIYRKEAMKYLTSSSLSKFRTCPRVYFYAYELKRVPLVTSDALSFGTAWHTAMEAWWNDARLRPDQDNAAHTVIAAEKMREIADQIKPEHAAMIAAMLEHYHPDASRFEVVGVEVPFETPIENPLPGKRKFYNYRLAGKVDVVLKDCATGDVWIADHKTTTADIMGFGPYWQALQVDGQMSNYCLAFGARGFVYDVARKPSIKLCGKDEKAGQEAGISPEAAYQIRCAAQIAQSTAEYYQWREHLKTDEELMEAKIDLWQQVEMFRACDKDGRWPRNSDACVNRYGTCPYVDVCTGRANLDDDTTFRTKEAVNEELVSE